MNVSTLNTVNTGASEEHKKAIRHQSPWSLRYKWLGAVSHGCWETNSGPLLLTTEHPSSS